MINTINLHILYYSDVSYASQHTFSKVTVKIFTTIYIIVKRGSGTISDQATVVQEQKSL